MPAMRDNILVGVDTPRKPKQIVIPPAEFVSRVWIVGDEISTPITTITVPSGANFCVATGIGSGGDILISASPAGIPIIGVAAGGGCYVKSYFNVTSATNMTTTVYPKTYPGNSLGTKIVYQSETVLYAPNGSRAIYAGTGIVANGGDVSQALGDIKYSGAPGAITIDPGAFDPIYNINGTYRVKGGNSGTYLTDILNVFGTGANNGVVAGNRVFSNAIQYGGGAAYGQPSSATPNFDSTLQAKASGGILVLEFYTSDPRVNGVYS